VPLPLPALPTVRVKLTRLKVAVQVMFAVTVTVPVVQPVPVQPANVEPLAATAVKATGVPLLKLFVQSLPQLMPVAVTVPLPVPALFTVSKKSLTDGVDVVAHPSFEYPEVPAALYALRR
jgi:hypothetical protein